MGLMSKLLGRQERASEEATMSTNCPHTTTTPRWNNAEDVGHLDRATGFRCESCGEMLGAQLPSRSV